jgi:hypothetical protein
VAAITARFEGRAGRKLRLKVGDIEELERLLNRAAFAEGRPNAAQGAGAEYA